MTKVFSVRINESLFDEIIKEIQDQGLNRKSFFETVTTQYFNKNIHEKQSIQHIYKQQEGDEYNLLCKALDSLPKRYNKDIDNSEVFWFCRIKNHIVLFVTAK